LYCIHVYSSDYIFNELGISIFNNLKHPCEEIIKIFMYIHHLLLYLSNSDPTYSGMCDRLLDYFYDNSDTRHKKKTPHMGIIMSLKLLSKKERDPMILIEESFSRHCMWAIKNNGYNIKKCLSWGKSGLEIKNMKIWKKYLWDSCKTGLQRSYFQVVYEDLFGSETLESMDMRFGSPSENEIQIFQKKIKEIMNWETIDPTEGYIKYFSIFNIEMTESILDKLLIKSLFKSTANKYHDHLMYPGSPLYNVSISSHIKQMMADSMENAKKHVLDM